VKFFCKRQDQEVNRANCNKDFCLEYKDCVASGYLKGVDEGFLRITPKPLRVQAQNKGTRSGQTLSPKRPGIPSLPLKTIPSSDRRVNQKDLRTSLSRYVTYPPSLNEKAALGKLLKSVTIELNENQKNELLDLIKRALATKNFTDQLVTISRMEAILDKLAKHARVLLELFNDGLDPRLRWMLSKVSPPIRNGPAHR